MRCIYYLQGNLNDGVWILNRNFYRGDMYGSWVDLNLKDHFWQVFYHAIKDCNCKYLIKQWIITNTFYISSAFCNQLKAQKRKYRINKQNQQSTFFLSIHFYMHEVCAIRNKCMLPGMIINLETGFLVF